MNGRVKGKVKRGRMISMRLSEEEFLMLKDVSVPYGGVTGFVMAMVMNQSGKTGAVVVKKKRYENLGKIGKEMKKEALKNSPVDHAANCSCFICTKKLG